MTEEREARAQRRTRVILDMVLGDGKKEDIEDAFYSVCHALGVVIATQPVANRDTLLVELFDYTREVCKSVSVSEKQEEQGG